MGVEDIEFDYADSNGLELRPGLTRQDHKVGFDVDAMAGYDFGMRSSRRRAGLQARQPAMN